MTAHTAFVESIIVPSISKSYEESATKIRGYTKRMRPSHAYQAIERMDLWRRSEREVLFRVRHDCDGARGEKKKRRKHRTIVNLSSIV